MAVTGHYLILSIALVVLAAPGLAQTTGSSHNFAIGAKMSTLGIGVEAGTVLAAKTNLRAAFNFFNYSRDFDKDGVSYNGKLDFRSFDLRVDEYVGKIFHITPGLMVYNGNKGSATASVPGGQSFTLGDNPYYSSAANPITGSGSLPMTKVAPEFLIGLGNMLPRNGHHVGVNFDIGVIYQGTLKSSLNLAGSSCTSSGTNCVAISSAPNFQANLAAEQTKIDNSLKLLRFYPIVSFGIAYSF